MKFSIGDKMVIKKTGEEGVIVSFIDSTMAEVLVDGTEFPIFLDEIDHPYLRWFTQKNEETQKKKKLREQIPVEKIEIALPKIATGIHLTFMPVFHTVAMEEQVERIKVFIVNHSHYTLFFKYQVQLEQQSAFSFQGKIQAFSDQYLHFLSWDDMQTVPRFTWELSEALSDQYASYKDVLKIRPAKLFAQIAAVQQDNLPTFRYTLLETFGPKAIIAPVVKIEQVIPKTKASIRSVQEIPKYEVDLHIEHLMPDQKGLSNGEILDIQLRTLEKYLDLALVNQQEQMLIVHGVGKGVLRNEVIKQLKKNPYIDHIVSGWQAGYGFGATVVHFKY